MFFQTFWRPRAANIMQPVVSTSLAQPHPTKLDHNSDKAEDSEIWKSVFSTWVKLNQSIVVAIHLCYYGAKFTITTILNHIPQFVFKEPCTLVNSYLHLLEMPKAKC